MRLGTQKTNDLIYLEDMSRGVSTTFFAFLLALGLSGPVWSQNCVPVNLTLTSQAQIDHFQEDFGPCDRVGNILIRGADITNLDGLAGLREVGTILRINDNPNLIDTSGLSSLTEISRLNVRGNTALTGIGPFPMITSVWGDVSIIDNALLEDLSGLATLTDVGMELLIQQNPGLKNLDGLAQLVSVGGTVSIYQNASLSNIDGLSGLVSIGEGGHVGNSELNILDNDALQNLDGLSALTAVGGILSIADNQLITNLDGLASLAKIGSELHVWYNPVLIQVDGLARLDWLDDLSLFGNSSLNNCRGLLKLVDPIDDGEPDTDPSGTGIPDIGRSLRLGSNARGCNSVKEILGSVPVEAINSGINDAWFNPETPGQGFFINYFPDIERLFLAWFTFDTERPTEDIEAILGEPGHRWLTAFGSVTGGQAQLNVEITEGGIFNARVPIPVQRFGGTITVDIDTCNSGSVTYDLFSGELSGILPIERIALDNVVLCYLLGESENPAR